MYINNDLLSNREKICIDDHILFIRDVNTTTTTFSVHVNTQSDSLGVDDTINCSIRLYSKQQNYYLGFGFIDNEEEGNNYLILDSTYGGGIV